MEKTQSESETVVVVVVVVVVSISRIPELDRVHLKKSGTSHHITHFRYTIKKNLDISIQLKHS